MINYLFASFFIIGIIYSLITNNLTISSEMLLATKTGLDLIISVIPIICLWLGIMNIAKKSGLLDKVAKLLTPILTIIFPEIPKNHPVNGSIMMNLAANMLGIDNAATPLGLKAMSQLQELNPKKDTASNSMIMFLVLNTSGLTLIPVSIMVYRAQMGAADPSDVFIPILIATFFSTLVGILAVSIYQKINLFNKVFLGYFAVFSLIISGLIWYFVQLPREQVNAQSSLIANVILFLIIISFIVLAVRKKVNVYEAFIEGAKEGFGVAIKIIPYLIAILVGVGVFRTSGALDFLIDGMRSFFALVGLNTDFVDALPTAFMKPLSGSGARGVMIETMNQMGADSFAGRLACCFQGSTDTTFYILAVYFGSVGIKKYRYSVACGLSADFAGIIAAVFISYFFFA